MEARPKGERTILFPADGRYRSRRTVQIGKERLLMGSRVHLCLLHLALARCYAPDGWWRQEDFKKLLPAEFAMRQRVYLVRQFFGERAIDMPIESDRRGWYRLDVSRHCIDFDMELVKQSNDYWVAQAFRIAGVRGDVAN